jgi:cellulose biosynthesis protein BcsQ
MSAHSWLGATGCGSWETRLRDVLEPLRGRFDFVLVDTPPGLGNLSGMAVLAADGLLIPARPADLDVRGAGKLYDLVETRAPDLRILGVMIAASDHRWRVARDASSRMTADQMRVLPVQIPPRRFAGRYAGGYPSDRAQQPQRAAAPHPSAGARR